MKLRVTRDSSLREVLLYLDTNIFLDLTRNRNPDSSTLFQNIKKGKYKAATSTFTVLEFMEEEQERVFAEREILVRKNGRNNYPLSRRIRQRITTNDSANEHTETLQTQSWGQTRLGL